jgi:hypothetical protein
MTRKADEKRLLATEMKYMWRNADYILLDTRNKQNEDTLQELRIQQSSNLWI